MGVLRDRIRAEIDAEGPMPFERYVDRALYDPEHGFYSVGGQAGGRRGDFVTSVETGPLFAALIGDWLDERWRAAGEPSDFRVAEAGAGVGTLFRGLTRSRPACYDTLVYTLVEQSAAMRDEHQELSGTQWRSSAGLPDQRQHVVVANELLDNLAFGIAERGSLAWHEMAVDTAFALVPSGRNVELDERLVRSLDALPVGTHIPIPTRAVEWIGQARRRCDRLLVFDYGATTIELARRGGWLRTYRGHDRGTDPFASIGRQDITADVPFDQLPDPIANVSQARWLEDRGLNDRVASAKATWKERAHIGDLQAMVARSAVNESQALTDPSGLGAFRALEW